MYTHLVHYLSHSNTPAPIHQRRVLSFALWLLEEQPQSTCVPTLPTANKGIPAPYNTLFELITCFVLNSIYHVTPMNGSISYQELEVPEKEFDQSCSGVHPMWAMKQKSSSYLTVIAFILSHCIVPCCGLSQ